SIIPLRTASAGAAGMELRPVHERAERLCAIPARRPGELQKPTTAELRPAQLRTRALAAASRRGRPTGQRLPAFDGIARALKHKVLVVKLHDRENKCRADTAAACRRRPPAH